MKTILVVDDNLVNLKYVNVQISPDYKVIPAKSGVQALVIAARHRPDLILMDVEMPELDGFATLERLRLEEWGRDLPVIFLSANYDAETGKRALEAGAGYVTKPFEREVLLEKIAAKLAR